VIRAIAVKNLRGLRSAEITELTRLLVLVGPNGSGKSTVLDAIDVGASPLPGHAVGRSVSRRATAAPSFRWLLWKGAEDHRAEIEISTCAGLQRRTLIEREGSTYHLEIHTGEGASSPQARGKVEFDLSNGYSQSLADPLKTPGVSFVRLVDLVASLRTPLHQLYTAAVEQGRRDEAMAIVRSLLDGASGVEILTEQDRPVLHVVFEDHSVPADLAGDGVAALLRLGLELGTGGQGVVLLEEPELHQHPAAIQLSARAIVAACERGVQVIVTTHSLELIDALLAAHEGKSLGEMTVCRTRLHQGELLTHKISEPDLDLARNQIESDLR
jgi:predicted ATPase